jgi:membrane-bound lytic murein transglycosylase D
VAQETLQRRESRDSNLRETDSSSKKNKNSKSSTAGRVGKAKSHVVRAGETAGAIAHKYGISVKQLVQANGLGRRAKIVTGQRLRIPGSAVGSSDSARDGSRQVVHVVRSGESLWSLARQYKVKVSDLRRWNNLRGNEIHAGSRLVIILSEEG